jgi:hypothetical protein
MTGNWTFDLTGYLLGIPLLLWGTLAPRYRGVRPIQVSRIIWILLGLVFTAGNIAQNIIEFQDL